MDALCILYWGWALTHNKIQSSQLISHQCPHSSQLIPPGSSPHIPNPLPSLTSPNLSLSYPHFLQQAPTNDQSSTTSDHVAPTTSLQRLPPDRYHQQCCYSAPLHIRLAEPLSLGAATVLASLQAYWETSAASDSSPMFSDCPNIKYLN